MKSLIMIIVIMFLMTSCGGGDGDSSPNDISGYWEGNGIGISNQVTFPLYMQAWFQPAGYGYYDVYFELYSRGYVLPFYAVWFYQSGQLFSQEGRIGKVNGNTMEILADHSGMVLKIDLYRY